MGDNILLIIYIINNALMTILEHVLFSLTLSSLTVSWGTLKSSVVCKIPIRTSTFLNFLHILEGILAPLQRWHGMFKMNRTVFWKFIQFPLKPSKSGYITMASKGWIPQANYMLYKYYAFFCLLLILQSTLALVFFSTLAILKCVELNSQNSPASMGWDPHILMLLRLGNTVRMDKLFFLSTFSIMLYTLIMSFLTFCFG